MLYYCCEKVYTTVAKNLNCMCNSKTSSVAYSFSGFWETRLVSGEPSFLSSYNNSLAGNNVH